MRVDDPVSCATNRPSFSLRTLLTPIAALAVCAALGFGAPVLAQVSQVTELHTICGGDLQNYGNCTAGEIAISQVTNVQFQGDPLSCVLGETLTVVTATVEYVMNTGQRYDLLLWIADQEGTDPREAAGVGQSCSVYSVPEPFNPTPDNINPFSDEDGDQCADIGASVDDTDNVSRDFTFIDVTCQDNDNDGFADLQVLLTWDQNAGSACGLDVGQSYPVVGAPSKCDYGLIGNTLPVVEPPELTLVKQVTNNSGGTALPGAWTLTATGPDVISGVTGSPAVTAQPVAEGVYTLSESGPAGYTGTWNCTGGGVFTPPNQVTLSNATPAQETTCTLTNDDNPATLTLAKTIVNDNGGTSVLADWTLTATGPTTVTGTADSPDVVNQGVPAGTYTLNESGPGGYTASAWSCAGGTQNGNQITLALGETATCTITNDDIGTQLTLTKIVTNDNGGNAVVGDWTLTADAIVFTSGVQQAVNAGTYTLAESGPAGYTAGSWQCSGDGNLVGNDLTLGVGDTASCTITNNDVAPGLTLLKSVTNDNGGNDPAGSFDLTLTGADGTHGAGVDYASGATPTVLSNVSYSVTETPNAGYTLTGVTCVDDASMAPVATIFVLDEGQSVTCTFANDDIAPSLTLVKDVVNNDGGSDDPSDFTLTLQGNDGTHNTPQNYSTGATPSVIANTPYTLDELAQPGYANAGVTCEDDDTAAPVAHPVSLAEGQSVTCTLTNDDIAAGTVTLIKQVVNDNGGTAVAGDFLLHIAGDDVDCNEDGTDDYMSGQTIIPVDGCTYTVSEEPLTGYTQGAITCVDTNDGGADIGHPFTFAPGQAVVCTVSNNDDGAQLALTKVVQNVAGGTAVATDWTLTADGPTPQSGAGGFASTLVNAGVYTLSESGPAGYTASAWDCGAANAQLSGDQLTLANGDDVSCTITNTDQASLLTLTKLVTNDNGGDAVAVDWTLSADNGVDAPVQGAGGFAAASVPAGTYTLGESGPSGYTAGAWDCTGDGSFTPPDQLTLETGDSATCTITNNDVAPSLTLLKDVTNDDGGTAVPASFTLTLQGADGVHDTPQNYSSGATPSVDANVVYTLDEQPLPGYVSQGVTCADGAGAPVPHPVTLNEGAVVICTLANDDTGSVVSLTKVVINDNEGTLAAGDFALTLTGADGTHDAGVDYVSGDAPAIQAGVSYEVSEDPPQGYSVQSIECMDASTQAVLPNPFTPLLDQSVACTVTNNDRAEAAYFRVMKNFSDNNPGEVEVTITCDTGLPLVQNFVISEGDDVNFVVTLFEAGAMNCDIVENTATPGYTPEYNAGIDGDGTAGAIFGDEAGCHFEEVEGGQFTCEIYNALDPVDLVVTKEWLTNAEDHGLPFVANADYTCYNVREIDGSLSTFSGFLNFEGAVATEVIGGVYPDFAGSTWCTVEEIDTDSAVEPDASECANVPVALGEDASCTIYNTVFFEGIPTLNQYGLILLALLMLGVGAVGFRRYA